MGTMECCEDKDQVLSNSTTKSSGLHEQDLTSASFQQNGSQKNLDATNNLHKEKCSFDKDPALKSNPSSSASSHHSSTSLLKTCLAEEIEPLVQNRHKKASPRRNENLPREWTFYPTYGNHTYHIGKKCKFDGVYLKNKTTSSEQTVEMCLGKMKHVDKIDSRNGIPFVTLGDHPYASPEQSTDFHKMGSTRPAVNFGSDTYKKKLDTFVPLQQLPGIPSVPFRVKKKQQELEREKMEVKNLEMWKPPPDLMHFLFGTGISRRLTYQ